MIELALVFLLEMKELVSELIFGQHPLAVETFSQTDLECNVVVNRYV